MAPAAPLLVAALLAALLPLCAAQTCEAFAGQPTYCAGRVSYLVYIPPGLSQADLVASLVNLTASFSLIQTISPGCASASADMGCSTAFRRCNASDPQLIPVCDTACNNYNLACPKIGAPLQDCSVRDAFSPGNPLYVSPSQEACTFANLTAGPGPLTCNYPFVPNPNIDECVIKCPTPGLDDPTYSKIYQVSGLVLSSISIVCLALLLMSGIATWDQRRAYAYFHVGALGIQLIGVWIGRWLPYDQWACTSPWQGRDQSNTAGALQAGLLMYGTHAAAMWNLVLVYTLLLRITENRYQIFGPGKFVPIDPEIVYGIVGWFLWPVPFTVAMFAGNWAKSAGWVVLPDAQAGAGWIFLALYIIPLTILASVQFTLMGLLFYYIARHAGLRGIQSQVRLVILCIHYIVRVLFGTIFSYVQHADRDKTRKRIEDWVACQLNPLGPGCPKPDLGYIGGVSGLVNALFVTTSGIVILLIFLDTNMLRVWWRWLRCGGFSPRSGTGSTSLVEEQSGTTSSRY